MTLKAIIEEVQKLSRAEQELLLEELSGLVVPDDAPLTPEQAADLDMRIEEYRSGKAVMIDGEEAMRRLRERQD